MIRIPKDSKAGMSKILQTGHRSKIWIFFLVFLLLGGVLRTLYLLELKESPAFTVPAVDAGFHDYWARGLVTGDWKTPSGLSDPQVSTSAYFRPPGYPYFLAFLYWIGGSGYLFPRIVQMVFGLGNGMIAMLIGSRWFGRRVGLIWTLLMLVNWVFLYFEGEFHAPVILIFLLLSMIYVLGRWVESNHYPFLIAAGLLLGGGALLRPNLLLFLPGILVWLGWVRRDKIVFWKDALIFSLSMITIILPVTIRNVVVANDLVLISSNAGINFYIGNHESATGQVVDQLGELGPYGTCFDYPALKANLELKLDKSLKDSEVSTYFTRQALSYIKTHPLHVIQLLVKKTVLFWGGWSRRKGEGRETGRTSGGFTATDSETFTDEYFRLSCQ